jgi:exopolyphosphatase/guanosine-5'-triphosphate,3'-diphosphate pyrophosphatase
MAYCDRERHPCIGKGRADLVIAGCAIFEAICRTWPAPRIRVADRGVRDGMLFQLMNAADAGMQPGHPA